MIEAHNLGQAIRPPRKNSADSLLSLFYTASQTSCRAYFSNLGECRTTLGKDNCKRNIPSHPSPNSAESAWWKGDWFCSAWDAGRQGWVVLNCAVKTLPVLWRSVMGGERGRTVCPRAEIVSSVDEPPAQTAVSPPNPSTCQAGAPDR